MNSILRLENVSKSYGANKLRLEVLASISLEVREREVVTVFGPNGCGKSTLVRVAAGVIAPDTGRVGYGAGAEAGRVPIVFQDYRRSLLPWLTLGENIALPFRFRGANKDEAAVSAGLVLAELGLDRVLPLRSRPYEVSGGQAQLAAIVRAVATGSSVCLLDEPFSSLDFFVSNEILRKVRWLIEQRSMSALFVSHDIEEALLLGDRVVFLSDRPSHVFTELEVRLTDRFSDAARTSPEFTAVREQALSVLAGIAGLRKSRVLGGVTGDSYKP